MSNRPGKRLKINRLGDGGPPVAYVTVKIPIQSIDIENILAYRIARGWALPSSRHQLSEIVHEDAILTTVGGGMFLSDETTPEQRLLGARFLEMLAPEWYKH